MLKGTDGAQFPTPVEEDSMLWHFSTDMCRSIWLTYQETVDVQGEFFFIVIFSVPKHVMSDLQDKMLFALVLQHQVPG